MKTNSTNLKKAATNSYVVWVSNYYRERNTNKEIRTILFGDIFHVYSVEFNKEDNDFSIQLLHHFSKEYGKDVKPVKGAKNLLIQKYEYGKKVFHEIRGGYKESDFEMKRTNMDVILDSIFDGPLY